MTLPTPSITLLLDIDESLDTEELRLEIKRCYTYVCSTLIRTHEAGTKDIPETQFSEEEGEQKINVAHLLIKMGTYKYLNPEDEGANELWEKSVAKSIHNAFFKISNNMQIYNKRQIQIGNEPLRFSWFDVELQNGELNVWFRLNSESAIDEAASQIVSAIREKLANKELGDGVKSLYLPSPSNYAIQLEEGLKAKAQREEDEKIKAEQERIEAEAEKERLAQERDEKFLESEEEEKDETALEVEKIQAELAEKYDLNEPDFELNYDIWQINYKDGSCATYDSKAEEMID